MFQRLITVLGGAALAIVLIQEHSCAQPDTLWTRWYGGTSDDEARSVQQTDDGGFIVAGWTESFGAGGKDVWLVKTDAQGDTLWTKTYGGTSDDGAWSINRTTDGGYIITGWTYSFGPGSSDIWLLKTDAQGDTLWTKTYGGTNEEWGNSAKQTSDGGFIIGGSTKSFAAAYWDFYLIRTNAVGDTVWTRAWDNDLNDDRGCSVLETADSGFVIVGYYWYDNGWNLGAWLIKTDSDGDTLWARSYGGAYLTRGYSVEQTSDDGFIIIGQMRFSYGAPSDLYLIKTNSTGDSLWSKSYGGPNDDAGNSVVQRPGGGYLIAGNIQSSGKDGRDVWLLETDADGDTTWTMTYGGTGDEEGLSVNKATAGGYIMAGYTTSHGAGGKDFYLTRLTYDVPHVLSASPTQNQLNVSVNNNVSVTFDIDMDQTTIDDSSFVLNARCAGLRDGTISYNVPAKTATFDPACDFLAGEVVTVMLSRDIRSSEGMPMDSSFAWSFTVAVGAGTGTFDPDASYAVGDSPRSVFAADLDGDGDLDLVTADRDNDRVSVLLNNGDGTFAPRSAYDVGGRAPQSASAADLDGDGDLDLATPNLIDGNVSVLLNDGDGSFPAYSTYAAGDWPRSVFAADLDGDADLDLAVTNYNSGNVSVFMNNGDGTFAPQSVYPVGTSPLSVLAADLDGDGDLDLATANDGSADVSVLFNDGTGVFGPDSVYSAGDQPHSVFAADFDADADLDLVCANWGSGNVSVLLSNGDGTFADDSLYAVGTNPYSVFAADFDCDGDLDLSTANEGSSDLSVLMNNGDGTFVPDSVYPVGSWPHSVFGADLDGDGDVDLATANRLSKTVSVLLNQGGTGVDEMTELHPPAFSLRQNYPNPFNPATTIRYEVLRPGYVTLKIFNILGQEVETIVSARQAAGEYMVDWDAANFTSGIYFYRLQVGEFSETRKLILLK